MRRLMLAAGLATLSASPASAQLAWDGPALVGPASPQGLSVFVADVAPGHGIGAIATLRRARGALDVGYRLAVGEGADGDIALGGGIDVSGLLTRGVDEADIDVSWWSGAGIGIEHDILFSVPLGIVAGWTGSGDDVVFSPYAGAHVSLDVASEGDRVDLNGTLDAGLDLTLVSGWIVRVGASFGSRDALAVGLRIPRGG